MEILRKLELTGVITSFDLLSVGIVIITTGILGFLVFLNDRKSATNKTFFAFTFAAIIWSGFNYLSYQFSSSVIVLWLLRLVMFSAVWYCFFIFRLFYVFPNENAERSRAWIALTSWAIFVSSLTLTPFVFPRIKQFGWVGQVAVVEPAFGILIFGVTVAGFLVGSVVLLLRKVRKAIGPEQIQMQLIGTGTVITFSLHIVFNFILPAFFDNPRFIPFGAFFVFPFIVFTSYATVKHRLFNIKVIATELLVFVIWIIILIEVLTRDSWKERILEGAILLFVVVFGIFLIRSVRKEVGQREKFELLSKELAAANARLQELDQMKTDFISIASHQLRTPLTAIKGYSSMILEGTYGESPIKIKGAVDKIFQSSQRLIYIVNDLLDVSRIEQGRFTLTPEDVKAGNLMRDVVEELKPNAIKKGLDLSFSISADDADVKIRADLSKIRQVFVNLVDNAIKYTFHGYVRASLKVQDGKVLVTVEDSGVGMSPQTISNLFQKFSRAKNVAKLHTDGSGLGLYIAKQIVESHNGKIWAESAGESKGSRFCVELLMNNAI